MNPYRTLRLPPSLALTLSAPTLALAVACTLANPAFAEKKKEAPPAKPAAQYVAFNLTPTSTSPSPPTSPLRRPQGLRVLPPPLRQPRPHPHPRHHHQRLRPGPLSRRRPPPVHHRRQQQDPRRYPRRHQSPPRFSTRSAMSRKIPLTPITIHHDALDKKVIEDDADFGFQSTTVRPHTTLAGYLFYDVRNLDDPPLKGASALRQMIHTADNQKQLFAFLHPLQQMAGGQPAQKPAKPADPVNTKTLPQFPKLQTLSSWASRGSASSLCSCLSFCLSFRSEAVYSPCRCLFFPLIALI